MQSRIESRAKETLMALFTNEKLREELVLKNLKITTIEIKVKELKELLEL